MTLVIAGLILAAGYGVYRAVRRLGLVLGMIA